MLDVRKATGPDGIQPRVRKELADVIAGPLSSTFQQSWEPGQVPANAALASRMELSAPLASLPMAPNWEVLLTLSRVRGLAEESR